MRRLLISFAAISLVAACSGGDGTTPPTGTPGITLTASANSGTIARGASSTTTLTLGRVDGYSGAVALTAEGVPAGVTVAFAPQSLTGTTLASTATISVASNAAVGNVSLTFRAAGSGVTDKTVVYTLTIPAPAITVAVGTATVTAAQGTTATAPITITRTNGATGAVTLTAEGLPANVTASFSPNPIASADATSTLTLVVGAGATVASSTITVRAAATGLTDQTTTFALSVTSAATPAYSLSASPAAVSVVAGQSTQSTVTITKSGGFVGNVALATEGAPAGMSSTFAPNPATGTTSTLTINTTLATVPGTYNLTVRGTTAGLTDRTIVFAVTVNAVQGITVTLAPTTLSIAQGANAQTAVTLLRVGGLTGDLQMTATGQPAGMTVGFAPATVTGTASTLTVTVGAAVAAGSYPITVTATGTGAVVGSATLNVTVTTPSGFTLSATGVSIAQGALGTSTVTITRIGGYANNVDLIASNVPANVSVAFAPASVSGTTSTLTFTVGAGAIAGGYTVTVSGTGTGAANQSTTVALTITAASGGNVAWRFCDAARIPLWFAFRDGTAGAWTRVTVGAANTYSFTITQSVGAVAYVLPGGGETDIMVHFDTRAGLQAQAASECSENPTAGKTLNGSVSGVGATESASIFHGGATATAAMATPNYQLLNVADGNQDLFGVRTLTTFMPPSSTLNRMFLQRNVNVAPGGTLPVVDFAGASSFAPATATITFANAGSDALMMTHEFRSANGSSASYFFDLFATGNTRTFYGVPTGLLAGGDLHGVFVLASPTGGPDVRAQFTYFRAVENRTITLGPLLSTVTLTSSTSGPLARPKAKGTIQAEYDDAFFVVFSQNGPVRSITLMATAAYFGAVSEYELETPNFVGIDGFNNAWGLTPGTSTTANVTAIGGISGIINQPAEGTTWRFVARTTSFTP